MAEFVKDKVEAEAENRDLDQLEQIVENKVDIDFNRQDTPETKPDPEETKMDEVTEPQLSEKKEPAKIEKTETSETKELDPSSQVPKELEPAISITEPEQTPLADEAKKEASEMAGTPRRGRKSAAPEPEKSGEEVGVRRSGRATRPSTKLSNADFVADPFDHDILISPAKQSDSKASTETSSPTKRGRPSKASQEAEKRVQSETSQPNDEIPVSPTKKQRGRPSKSSLVLKPVSDGESIQSPSKKQGRPSKQFQETATAVKTSPTKRSINVSPTKAKRNKPEVEGQLEVKGVTKIDSKTSPDEKQKAASKLSRNKRNVVPSTSATASASTLAAPPQKTEAESQRVASVPAVAKPETEEKKDDELDLNLDFDGPSRVAPVINTYSRKSKTYIEAEDDYILQEILDDGSPTRASRRSRYLELLDEEHEEFVDDKTDDLKRDTKTGDTADTPVATTSKHVCSKVVPEQPEEKMSAKVTAKKSVEQIGVTAPRKRFRLHNDQDFVGETITSMEQNEPQSNGRSRQDEKADSVVSETNLTAETGSGKKRTATKGKEEVTKTAAGRKGRGSAGETEAKPAGRRGRSAEAEIKATTAAGRRGGKTKKDEAAVVEKEILPATNKISSLPKEEASPFGRRGRGSSAASVKEGVSQSAPNSRGKRGRDQTAKEEPAPEEEVTAAVKPGGRKGRSSSAKEVSAPAKDNRRMVLPSKEETANTVEGTATVAPAKEALDSLEKSPQKRGMGQSTSNEPDKKKRRGRASASAASVTKLNDVESTDAKVKNGGKRKANANISILEDDEKLTHPNKKLKGSQVSKHKELSSGQEDLDISVSSTRGKRTPLAMEDVDNGGVNRRSRSTTKKVEALRRVRDFINRFNEKLS